MKEKRKTNYSFIYYQRNEDKPKYLFLNYERNEDNSEVFIPHSSPCLLWFKVCAPAKRAGKAPRCLSLPNFSLVLTAFTQPTASLFCTLATQLLNAP